jgi:hypothetical protein
MKDENGRPMFAYCIEGAINQATYDVLGEKRALALGAIKVNGDDTLSFDGQEDALGFDPTMLLGLDQIAYEWYGEELEDGDGGACAMAYNDNIGTHEGVLGLLREGLARVRAKMK